MHHSDYPTATATTTTTTATTTTSNTNPSVTHSTQMMHKDSSHLSDYELALRLQQEDDNSRNDHTTREALPEMQCSVCSSAVQLQYMYFVEPCEHAVCIVCLRSHLYPLYNQHKYHNFTCPHQNCHNQIPQHLLKKILKPHEFEHYLQASIKQLVKTNEHGTYVHCPSCDHSFESMLQPRHVLEERIKNSKRPLTEANIHREQNRFRCRQCQSEFCSRCQAEPYHSGYTCSQYKAYLKSRKCRFCHAQISTTDHSSAKNIRSHPISDVCNLPECLKKANLICTKTHSNCNHPCMGIRDEEQCLPCLMCSSEDSSQTHTDFCNICWVEDLQSAPCIMLKCSHVFHYECLAKKIESSWPGARITFGFLKCPLCQELIEHPSLEKLLQPSIDLKEKVEEKALQRLKYQNLDKSDDIVKPNGKFYQKPLEFAIHNFAYYPCYECKEPYFGGMRQCDQNAGDGNNNFKKEHLICGKCSAKQCGEDQKCPKHGTEYILYKCRYCCNPSTWFCWGTTRFCDSCHARQVKDQSITRMKKDQLPKCEGPGKCPTGGHHAPNGDGECIIGCMLCGDATKDF